MRDSAGISPDFALPWNPGWTPGHEGTIADRAGRGDGAMERPDGLAIVAGMKRLVLIAGAAVAAAFAASKVIAKRATPPSHPGSWELADDREAPPEATT